MSPTDFHIEVALDIVTLPEMSVRLGVPVGRMRRMVAVPAFPRPLRTIAGSRVWSISEVEAWLATTQGDAVPALADLRVIVQQLIPSEWSGLAINLGCYRIEHAEPFGASGAVHWRRGMDTVVAAFNGEIEYYDPGKTLVTSHNGGVAQMTGHAAPIRVGPGHFLLIATRLGGDDDSRPMRSIRALACAIGGRNCAFEEVFHAHVKPEPDSVQLTADSSMNPGTFPPIGEVPVALDRTMEAIAAIDDSVHRQKVTASLNWYEQSLDGKNTDGFVRCWIALETLAMTGASIEPVVDRLANIYELKSSAVHDRFGPRALQKLRNRIVHSGDVAGVHHRVLDHLSAMYVDLLRDVLGLDPIHQLSQLADTRLVLDHVRNLVRGEEPIALPIDGEMRRYVRFAMDVQFVASEPDSDASG